MEKAALWGILIMFTGTCITGIYASTKHAEVSEKCLQCDIKTMYSDDSTQIIRYCVDTNYLDSDYHD